MYDGYLAFGGVEIINAGRAAAYLEAFVPRVEVRCDADGLGPALGHTPYVSPAADDAPWYQPDRPATGRFYGLFPGKMTGAEDSTRQVPVTELTGDGAVHTMARYAAREIRFVATAFAADEAAMEEGIAWLRDVLAADGCGVGTGALGCTGHIARVFSAKPASMAEALAHQRTFYKVETIEGPRVAQKFPVKGFLMWEVEFTLRAGRPWAFSAEEDLGTVDLPSGSSYTDPAWENCSLEDDAYNDFIDDPYFTAIAKPPRPAVILPPNILDIASWRRRTLVLPPSVTQRWGRVVPVARVMTSGTSAQFIRLRFYRGTTDLFGCGYDGEFLVSYLPANAILTLDGIRQEVSVTLADGRVVPGGHLLYGSDGRPFAWPEMGCQETYTMTADMMPGQTGITVSLGAAVRE